MDTTQFEKGSLMQCEIRDLERYRSNEAFAGQVRAGLRNAGVKPFLLMRIDYATDTQFLVVTGAEHLEQLDEVVRRSRGLVMATRPAEVADHGSAGSVASDGNHQYLIVPDKPRVAADSALQVYVVRHDEGPELEIMAERIAHMSSGDEHFNNKGRWTELTLYRTAAGKFVACEVGRSINPGERDRSSYWVCSCEEQVVECLGVGRLAKDLFKQAGINAATALA